MKIHLTITFALYIKFINNVKYKKKSLYYYLLHTKQKNPEMNQFYDIVESVINDGSTEHIVNLVNKINQNHGESSKEYQCGENVFYVLKRLCAAALARDPKIKLNASNALTELEQKLANLKSLNKAAFAELFLSITDMAECKSKQQKNAYIQGKVTIASILSEYFQGNEKIVSHFVKLISETETLQEQIIEVVYKLAGSKFAGLKINATQQNAKHLIQILTKKPVSQADIEKILSNAIEEYPKQSITLKQLGLNFSSIVESPQTFFKQNYAEFLNVNDEQTDDGDLKKLYYILFIQKYFLENVEINSGNISKFLCTEMITAWLEEVRVKNKHMKKLANSIKINFNSEPEFSFQVLKYLHEQKMYLENISVNHPFAELYKNVDSSKFWSYLVELIGQQTSTQEMTEEEEESVKSKREEYFSELEYIVRQKIDSFTPQQIGETLTILIKAFQASKRSEKLLNLVWSLFHSLVTKSEKTKSKKKIVLNTKAPLILSKIKLENLELEQEIQESISKTLKFLRIKVKAHKESEDKVILSFLNFVTGLILYCIVYPEQSDICEQIEFIFKDIEALLAKESGKDTLKKKVKKSQQAEDPKKPIHVLVEVFISLLTKAPIFLRNSINLVFEQFVPYIEKSDIETLLEVIQKPDQEYIEQI